MLEYDRIDLSKGINTNKNILTSKKCYLCGYWYFINKDFNYQKYMCNGCKYKIVRKGWVKCAKYR